MKCSTKELRAAIAICAPLTRGCTSLHVLSMVRIESTGGTLTVRSTNLDCHIEARCAADGDLPAVCCSPLLLAAAAVGDGVDITHNGKSLVIDGDAQCEVSTISADEFPPPIGGKWAPWSIDCTALAEGIGAARAAQSTEQARYILCGVHVVSDGQRLVVEASDGRRLHRTTSDCTAPKRKVIIPADYAEGIGIAARGASAQVFTSENGVRVEHESGSFTCKQLEGAFPNADQAIPRESKCHVLVSGKSLLGLVRAAKAFTTEKFASIRIEFGSSIRVTASAPECGSYAASLPIKCNGAVKIAVNPDYLGAALRDGEMRIDLIDEISPLKITQGNFLGVISPMRLS